MSQLYNDFITERYAKFVADNSAFLRNLRNIAEQTTNEIMAIREQIEQNPNLGHWHLPKLKEIANKLKSASLAARNRGLDDVSSSLDSVAMAIETGSGVDSNGRVRGIDTAEALSKVANQVISKTFAEMEGFGSTKAEASRMRELREVLESPPAWATPDRGAVAGFKAAEPPQPKNKFRFAPDKRDLLPVERTGNGAMPDLEAKGRQSALDIQKATAKIVQQITDEIASKLARESMALAKPYAAGEDLYDKHRRELWRVANDSDLITNTLQIDQPDVRQDTMNPRDLARVVGIMRGAARRGAMYGGPQMIPTNIMPSSPSPGVRRSQELIASGVSPDQAIRALTETLAASEGDAIRRSAFANALMQSIQDVNTQESETRKSAFDTAAQYQANETDQLINAYGRQLAHDIDTARTDLEREKLRADYNANYMTNLSNQETQRYIAELEAQRAFNENVLDRYKTDIGAALQTDANRIAQLELEATERIRREENTNRRVAEALKAVSSINDSYATMALGISQSPNLTDDIKRQLLQESRDYATRSARSVLLSSGISADVIDQIIDQVFMNEEKPKQQTDDTTTSDNRTSSSKPPMRVYPPV